MPEFSETEQPHFLFIVTPPNSGSSALAELLNTSQRTMLLTPKGEGQWLIPALCKKDRWNPDKEVDYQSVKAVWLSKFQNAKRLAPNIDVVIEKSPPNMVRLEKISSQFREYSFLVNIRNPYATCSSSLYRNCNADATTSETRRNKLNRLAESWLKRSAIIRLHIRKLGVPIITYEQFCQDPSSVLGKLRLPDGVSSSVNPRAKVKVKDYKPQVISNQNDRQISRLTTKEIEQIGVVLGGNEQLLNYFGYQID